ncbi:MAG TPA: hypothetical protein VGG16_15935 [Streptosporangiaceae bacterium]
MRAFARLVLAAVLLGLWAAPAANASVGVGIQADPVRLSGTAHPGGSYLLPTVYVVNTGTQTETLTMRVERLHAGGGQSVPGSWIQSSWTHGSSVAAGQSAEIPLELVPPADAKPGSYSSDIVVTGTPPAGGGDVRFGAAAATGLDFRITAAPPGGFPAWKLWTLVALIVAGAGVLICKRLGLRVRIDRQGGRFGA